MSYIFKQKFDLNDLVSQPQVEFKTILVAEPEEYLLNLYCDYLSNHNYIPHACSHINLLESKTVLHRPDLLLLSLDLFADKPGGTGWAPADLNNIKVGFESL
jgi:hypothetical protein